jgi:hypothetical protein
VVDAIGGGAATKAGANLGSVGKHGGTVDVGCIVVKVAKMLASRWSAATWLLLVRESEEAGDKCWRAVVRSRAAAMARSAEDAVGIATRPAIRSRERFTCSSSPIHRHDRSCHHP